MTDKKLCDLIPGLTCTTCPYGRLSSDSACPTFVDWTAAYTEMDTLITAAKIVMEKLTEDD